MKNSFQRCQLLAACALLLLVWACGGKKQETPVTNAINYAAVATPTFNADSAYSYVAAQLQFGFRSPGSKGHEQCAQYLVHQMSRWCDTVIVQEFSTTLWNGDTYKGKNIIASFNPEKENRVLLAAHWDSRLWADHDPDEANHKKPIMGANDGASGVGTLMEMARVMSAQRPNVGIDIVFFDMEDQGIPEWAGRYEDNTWCLGSQYWAKYPHNPFYHANYGILFDMVGSQQPRFTKEEVSRNFAAGVTNKLWNAAAALGKEGVFVNINTDAILDDHLYVNQILRIPMVDIVQNSADCSFFTYWHTIGDNLDVINKESMKTVADVTMKTIYADFSK